MEPDPPTHPKLGPALKFSQFYGSARAYAWYLAVVGCILLAAPKQARDATGVNARAFHTGVKRMWTTGSLAPKPRARARTVYTEGTMQAAFQLLVNSLDLLNFTELYLLLKLHGYLDGCGSLCRFRRAYKGWCKVKDIKLIVNSRRTTFWMAPSDYPARAAYCSIMLKYLKSGVTQAEVDRMLASLIFVDEVTLEEVPHQKGEHAWNQQTLMHACPQVQIMNFMYPLLVLNAWLVQRMLALTPHACARVACMQARKCRRT